MPMVQSTYKAPWYLPGGMLQTVVAGRRKRPTIQFERTTLTLIDGDFIDLDWQRTGNKNLIILTHGLEGSSQSQYVKDVSIKLKDRAFDLLAWNCRSCSGRMNRLPKLYHHGEIADISEVIQHVATRYDYEKMYLLGFSMGGNISVKFLALNTDLKSYITKCAIVSTPCDLAAASRAMDLPKNKILRKYFMKNLRKKLQAKESQFPGSFPMDRFDSMKSWYQFDSEFVAPFVGYDSAESFYADASANSFFRRLTTPTFLINAKNDPVLGPSCHPKEQAINSKYLFFELSSKGGHVYFPMKGSNYSVDRALAFFEE